MKKSSWEILFGVFIMLFMVGCNSEATAFITETSPPNDERTITTTLEAIKFSPTTTQGPTLSPKQREMKSGMEIGETIISALEDFHQDNGYYPENLHELVPEYLAEIPFTTTGKEFDYLKYSEDYSFGPYMLAFDCVTVLYVGCAYQTKYSEWQCTYYPPE